jgi:hypothetical protein
MLKKLKKYLEKIQKKDERAKWRYAIFFSSVTVFVISIIWFSYFSNYTATPIYKIEQKTTFKDSVLQFLKKIKLEVGNFLSTMNIGFDTFQKSAKNFFKKIWLSLKENSALVKKFLFQKTIFQIKSDFKADDYAKKYDTQIKTLEENLDLEE